MLRNPEKQAKKTEREAECSEIVKKCTAAKTFVELNVFLHLFAHNVLTCTTVRSNSKISLIEKASYYFI